MAYKNRLLSQLSKKKILLGSGIHTREPVFAELLGSLYDFLWIDWEHTWLDRGDILNNIIACKTGGAASVVRVPWNDPVIIKPLLEMGPDAIAIPQISSLKEAKEAIKACTYPPKGCRGWGPNRAVNYGLLSGETYRREAKQRTAVILQIEDVKCFSELDEILELDGFDVVLVGPHDMSGSIGKLGQIRDPEVMEAYDEMGKIVARHKKPFMVSMSFDVQSIKEWMRRGVTIFHIDGEIGLMVAQAKHELAELDSIFSEVRVKESYTE